MADKNRLDVLLFERGFTDSREKAKKLINDGSVAVNGKPVTKAGFTVSDSDVIELCGDVMPYVSRGGYKLEKAIKVFEIDLNGCICADIGASTGGFTDCMLQNGAVKVFSVDVGSDQLSYKLRSDTRVINLEKTNFRYADKTLFGDEVDFASVDVSFISLKHILPNLFEILTDSGKAVCLIKPQFEAGKEHVGKNGVVKEASTHIAVVENIYDLAVETGFGVSGIDFSPIKGPQGNIEYLIMLCKNKNSSYNRDNIKKMVELSHIGAGRGEAL